MSVYITTQFQNDDDYDKEKKINAKKHNAQLANETFFDLLNVKALAERFVKINE